MHWAGYNSSVLVVLTKNVTYSDSKVKSSNVYFSYDYGKTFVVSFVLLSVFFFVVVYAASKIDINTHCKDKYKVHVISVFG